MELTQEQKEIIAHTGNVKIDAVAGSGKTSTLIEYAKRRPESSRILYLAFNRSVREEAKSRFREAGLSNVAVHTAHSLAFSKIVPKHKYTVSPGYKAWELAELLKIPVFKTDPMVRFLLASHVLRMMQLFCNSDKLKFSEVDYIGYLQDAQSIEFAEKFLGMIRKYSVVFWTMMNKGEIPVTHDFYLKKFQLNQPRLPYHFLLFDEGQDASPVMLDVFLKQLGTKVVVGDTHQQIYGWRHAVNSLEQVDFPRLSLTASFRFSQKVADLARSYLEWKKVISDCAIPEIRGLGGRRMDPTRATLARTNLSLLMRAIEMVYEEKSIGSLYFEGNLNSYTYSSEGGVSVYDVLALKNGRNRNIRNGMIRKMPSFEGLETFARKAGDAELNMMVEIVKEYGNDLPTLIGGLKERQVPDADRNRAEMIFSTVHRCKGLEYGEVNLCGDYTSEAEVKKVVENHGRSSRQAKAMKEEVNLLYVAVTRTMNLLNIPEMLLPGYVEETEEGAFPPMKQSA